MTSRYIGSGTETHEDGPTEAAPAATAGAASVLHGSSVSRRTPGRPASAGGQWAAGREGPCDTVHPCGPGNAVHVPQVNEVRTAGRTSLTSGQPGIGRVDRVRALRCRSRRLCCRQRTSPLPGNDPGGSPTPPTLGRSRLCPFLPPLRVSLRRLRGVTGRRPLRPHACPPLPPRPRWAGSLSALSWDWAPDWWLRSPTD
jgi:hypothetical protein